MNPDIHQKLQNTFRSVFQNEALIITESTSAENIDMWDSLTHVELIAEVEDAFSITFSFNEIMQFNNVGDMLKLIGDKLRDRS